MLYGLLLCLLDDGSRFFFTLFDDLKVGVLTWKWVLSGLALYIYDVMFPDQWAYVWTKCTANVISETNKDTRS